MDFVRNVIVNNNDNNNCKNIITGWDFGPSGGSVLYLVMEACGVGKKCSDANMRANAVKEKKATKYVDISVTPPSNLSKETLIAGN